MLSSPSISDKLNISNCCLPSHAGCKDWRIPLSKELPWRIQGRGSGSPIIFRPNCGPKGGKNLFLDPPSPHPYLKVWIRYWIIQNSKLKMRIKYCDKLFIIIFRVVELTRLPREIIYGSERLQVRQTMLLNLITKFTTVAQSDLQEYAAKKLDILVNNHF